MDLLIIKVHTWLAAFMQFALRAAVIIIDYTGQQFVSSINKTDSNNLGKECENKLYE
jgi:hypothetical protein